ncbi:MAG TPA: RluA family pseudouridine synthase [Sphaerochaeta sp.]|nr:RluA family pseudouridine synthase [Sphaerochaeta sp.]
MAINEHDLTLTVGELEEPMRLDAYLALQGIRRSILSEPETKIVLNGKPAKKGKAVKNGDVILVSYTEEVFEGLCAQDLPLSVLYEDSDLLVIDKQQGMVVHPAVGNLEGTVVNALLYRYGMDFGKIFSQETSDAQDEEEEEITLDSPLIRPGIVHRLDKDTSGTLIIARNLSSYRSLLAQFKAHTTTKTYVALARGNFSRVEGSIQQNIKRDSRNRKRFVTCGAEEGRTALTHYRVLRQFAGYALVRINIHTGRTHQIRVHLASLGHPLIGDIIYGKEDATTLMLHALELQVDHPVTNKRLTFRSPLPLRFLQYVKGVRK